ncbi:unnamed protein product, partial [Linum tenue]
MVGPFSLCCKSEINLFSHTASHAASVAAIYSASAEDRATVFCFFELHEMGFEPRQNMYPDVLFRSSSDPAQSLSVYSVSLLSASFLYI